MYQENMVYWTKMNLHAQYNYMVYGQNNIEFGIGWVLLSKKHDLMSKLKKHLVMLLTYMESIVFKQSV